MVLYPLTESDPNKGDAHALDAGGARPVSPEWARPTSVLDVADNVQALGVGIRKSQKWHLGETSAEVGNETEGTDVCVSAELQSAN